MSLEEYAKDKLWPILVEAVHALVLYPNHKAYTREVILHEKPDITPQELAARLGMPLGEAIVILYELEGERKTHSSKNLDA
ncbi:hypothetical protein C0195_01315 [Candidatus Bathyarchaeota archaeon]|nr:MAG: hypothetical protein C0195_01315 [Candidatus Bathyarchaeota archaeon]